MERFIDLVLILMLALALVILVVFIPLVLIAESDCLDKGYPKAKVTIGLDAYCIGIDGDVKNRVLRLEK